MKRQCLWSWRATPTARSSTRCSSCERRKGNNSSGRLASLLPLPSCALSPPSTPPTHATRSACLGRLRNPWRLVNGVQRAPEWRGAWSTSSPEWQSQPGLATSLGGRPRDGSFWMTFADFLHGFNKINVCRVFGVRPLPISKPPPQASTPHSCPLLWQAGWTIQRVHGAWTTEEAGGMCTPPPRPPCLASAERATAPLQCVRGRTPRGGATRSTRCTHRSGALR